MDLNLCETFVEGSDLLPLWYAPARAFSDETRRSIAVEEDTSFLLVATGRLRYRFFFCSKKFPSLMQSDLLQQMASVLLLVGKSPRQKVDIVLL